MSKSIVTTKFATYTFGGKPVEFYRVERESLKDSGVTATPVGSHMILILDRSGSMYGTMRDVKSVVRKLLTLSEFNTPNLMVSLVTYSSSGDVKKHFHRVPVSEVMRTDSPQLREVDNLQATCMTCISQSLVMAEGMINDNEVTAITLHTDGFANDASPSSEARAIGSIVKKLATHPKVFVNTIAHGGWCDYGMMSSISNALSGVCLQARDIHQVYSSIHGTMALLAGSVAPAVEIAKGRANYTMFVSTSAKKVLLSDDNMLVQGLSEADDKSAYRLYKISENEYNSLSVPVNGDTAEVNPILAYARGQVARGNLNTAKYAMVATRNGDLLAEHAKALVSSEVAALAGALEGALFAPTAYRALGSYGLPSTGPSVLSVLSTLHLHRASIQVDMKALAAGYQRRGVKRIPGVRREDGSVEAPSVESRYRTASDSFAQVNGFELNRNTASINMLVSQPMDIFRVADNTRIANVAGVDLGDLRSFNNYTIVGDGSVNVKSLTLKTGEASAYNALKALGLALGAFTPNAPFMVDLSTLPLVDYNTTFDTINPEDLQNLTRITVLSKILDGLVKGESVSLTTDQIAKLKEIYMSPGLNFSPPTTTEYADLQEALAKGQVDTKLSYKINFGTPAMTSVGKLKSGNEYLQRRFAATQGSTKVDKPTLNMVADPNVTFSLKKLTSATKLDAVDDISYPIYEGFLGLGDTKPVHDVLKLVGCMTPTQFLKDIRSGNKEAMVEAVSSAQECVNNAIEAIYNKLRPLAFYIGASGIVPDSLGAVSMSSEDFATKYPEAKLSKDEKDEGTFFVLPNGTVITVFVKGEYFSTGN